VAARAAGVYAGACAATRQLSAAGEMRQWIGICMSIAEVAGALAAAACGGDGTPRLCVL